MKGTEPFVMMQMLWEERYGFSVCFQSTKVTAKHWLPVTDSQIHHNISEPAELEKVGERMPFDLQSCAADCAYGKSRTNTARYICCVIT